MINVISMLSSENVERAAPQQLEDAWVDIFDYLVDHGRIRDFGGADLAILCKIIAAREEGHKGFWSFASDHWFELASKNAARPEDRI